MKKTVYEIENKKFGNGITFALVSDLHGEDPEPVIDMLKVEKPDYILMPGDIFECLDGTVDRAYDRALKLLRASTEIAPTFYVTGNHEDGGVRSWSAEWKNKTMERCYHEGAIEDIKSSGVTFLGDSFVLKNGIAFGGLASGLIFENGVPNTEWLSDFCRADAPRVLLCHHPEYYEKYLKELPLDLIVSGHAHGGQWRFFGRGVFAPGQGIFPKYTYGVHDNRFVIGTGLKRGSIPRFFNAPEVVFIKMK